MLARPQTTPDSHMIAADTMNLRSGLALAHKAGCPSQRRMTPHAASVAHL